MDQFHQEDLSKNPDQFFIEEIRDIDGLLIDPAGVIYESSTRQPVSGVTVKSL